MLIPEPCVNDLNTSSVVLLDLRSLAVPPLIELVSVLPVVDDAHIHVEFEVCHCKTWPFEQLVNATFAISNNDEPDLFIARQTKPAPSALVENTAIDSVITPKITINVEYFTTP